MSPVISNNQYGKANVKLMKLDRNVSQNSIKDLTIQITLKGDMEAAFKQGDNQKVVPTDTMKNTVYILAKRHNFSSTEEFGEILTKHFVTNYEQITSACVVIEETAWKNMITGGQVAKNAFSMEKSSSRVVEVNYDGSVRSVKSGIDKLTILKSEYSGFENYVMDEYTTLKPTADRILATTLTSMWEYTQDVDYQSYADRIRDVLLSVFAAHHSKSVQETLYDMGQAVLDQFTEVVNITISMPNEHKVLFDLQKFGLENNNELFVPTPEPFGVIEATLSRE
jgi:urate oxidase